MHLLRTFRLRTPQWHFLVQNELRERVVSMKVEMVVIREENEFIKISETETCTLKPVYTKN